MVPLVFFTRSLPSPLLTELEAHGFYCYEALALSEVFHVCEKPEIRLVVIDSSIDEDRASIVQWLFPALRLKADDWTCDILESLSDLLLQYRNPQ